MRDIKPRRGETFSIHDIVRNYVLRYLKARNPKLYQRLHNDSAEYFLKQQNDLESRQGEAARNTTEWSHFNQEYLYHLIQADERSGIRTLLGFLGDSLNERIYDHAYLLTQLFKRPISMTGLDLSSLAGCCQALKNGDTATASKSLEVEFKEPAIEETSDHFAMSGQASPHLSLSGKPSRGAVSAGKSIAARPG